MTTTIAIIIRLGQCSIMNSLIIGTEKRYFEYTPVLLNPGIFYEFKGLFLDLVDYLKNTPNRFSFEFVKLFND
jgi:hypothetical protein